VWAGKTPIQELNWKFVVLTLYRDICYEFTPWNQYMNVTGKPHCSYVPDNGDFTLYMSECCVILPLSQEATSSENRSVRPWIIIMGHRPMYCSNDNTDDCTNHETWSRVGIPFLHWLVTMWIISVSVVMLPTFMFRNYQDQTLTWTPAVITVFCLPSAPSGKGQDSTLK
jgi:hypothetical protein